jgi:predicted Zn-dependent protease
MSNLLKLTKSIFFILSICSAFAQKTETIKFYEYPEHLPEKYHFNPQSVYNQAKTDSYKGIKKIDAEIFAQKVAYGKQSFVNDGLIYIGWDEMESYVNEVFSKIKKKDDKTSYVYLFRDYEINAFTIYDGSIFINIGLLAELQDEAALACILAHEYAHYINADVKNSYINDIKTYNKTKKSEREEIQIQFKNREYSRETETIADKQGYEYALAGGYNIESASSYFTLFIKTEDRGDFINKNRKKYNLTVQGDNNYKFKQDSINKATLELLRTHPDAKKRMDVLNATITTNKCADCKTYQVGKKKFEKLKKQAKYEALNIMLQKNKLYDAIETAFKYHLIEPDNTYFIEVLLEAIRRKILITPASADKGFLSEHYDKVLPKGKGVLSNLGFIMMDENYQKLIKAENFLDDQIEFETYKQGFEYFSKVAIDKNITEAHLSNALFYVNDNKKFNNSIEEYLKSEDAKHKEYAEHLKNNTLLKSLQKNKRDLVFIDEVGFYVRKKENYPYILESKNIQMNEEYKSYMKANLKNFKTQKEYLLLDEMKNSNYKNYIYYKESIINSIIVQMYNTKERYKKVNDEAETLVFADEEDYARSESSKKLKKNNPTVTNTNTNTPQLFFLSPNYWEFFNNNNIKSINYINFDNYRYKMRYPIYDIEYLLCMPYYLPFYILIHTLLPKGYFTVDELVIDVNSDYFLENYNDAKFKKLTKSRFMGYIRETTK